MTYAKTNAKQNSTSRIFSGVVVAKFEVLSSVVRTGEPLKIRLVLENRSRSTVNFRYVSGSFVEHIRIYDAQHREVSFRLNAPFLESAAEKISLRPAETFATVASVDLWQFYDLPAGKYELRFYYDLRLISERKLADEYMQRYHSEDWVIWDTKRHPFSVQGSRRDRIASREDRD